MKKTYLQTEPTSKRKHERGHLDELSDQWYCTTHLKPGSCYCWIKPADAANCGGHHEMLHKDMTLWAKYIVSNNEKQGDKIYLPRIQETDPTNKHSPPNLKKLDVQLTD